MKYSRAIGTTRRRWRKSSTPWKPATARRTQVWALDRGMVSQDNLDFLKAGGRQYIVGTPKSQLRRFEQQLAAHDWRTIREGLEVKLCPCPDGSAETYILCRSRMIAGKKNRRCTHGSNAASKRGWLRSQPVAPRRRQEVGPIERRGMLAGTEHAGRGLVRGADSCRRPRRAQVTWRKVEEVAGVGPTQRRLIRAAQQRD